jgi:hypothetical protein
MMVATLRPFAEARVVLFAIALIALSLRLLTLARPGISWAYSSYDSIQYTELADGLRNGCGFARLVDSKCAPPESLRTPGYPVFLRLMPSLRSAIALQACMCAAVCFFLGSFVYHRWGIAAGALAALLFACDIPSIVASGSLMTECLFQSLLTVAVLLGLWAALSPRISRSVTLLILGAALLLGVATLVRPIGFLSPLLAPIPVLFVREASLKRKISLAVAAFLLPALIAGAWIIRNGRRTGVWALSTVAAYDLYNYRAAGIVWSRAGGTLADAMIALAHEQGFSKPPEYYSPELYHDTIRRSIRILTADPVATARMTIRAFLWLTVVPDRGDLNVFLGAHGGTLVTYPASEGIARRLRDLLHSPALTGLVTLEVLITIFVWSGVVCAVVMLRKGRDGPAFLLLIPLAIAMLMILLAAGPEASGRMRTPAIPFLSILAGIGWSDAARKYRIRRMAPRTESL